MDVMEVPQETNSMSLIMNANDGDMAHELQAITNFQGMVQKNLVSGQDYGVIPGTGKPTLLKPGAEKIQMLMGVASEYEVIDKVEDYEKGFFAYTVKCTLSHGGQKITDGLGSCNCKEKKYVSQDPFSIQNTLLKMAKKRAQIDATLTIASLSNVFTQDIEDIQNFNRRETMETMNSNDASSMKVTFGKNKGKTLGEIAKSDRGYVEWLAKNAKQDEMKQAASMVLNPPAHKQATSEPVEPPVQAPEERDEPQHVSSNRGVKLNLIVGYSKNIAQALGTEPSAPAIDAIKAYVKDFDGSDDAWNSLDDETIQKTCIDLEKLSNTSKVS